MSDPIEKAKTAVETIKTVMEIAGGTPELKKSGEELATSTLTVTKFVNNVLMPIAAVNYAFDKARIYFHDRFEEDLAEVTKSIPQDQVVEPKPSLAAPVLQGIAFCHEEAALKDMYLKLLSSAMDGRKVESAHPAFAEVIKQLSSEEAQILQSFLQGEEYVAIVRIKVQVDKKKRSYVDKFFHLVNLTETSTGTPKVIHTLPSMIDNWVRLGLVRVNYQEHLSSDGAYDWVEDRPEYLAVSNEILENQMIELEKGTMSKTEFGKIFASVVL